MQTIPSTTVRNKPKRPVTTGARSFRRFDGDAWELETKAQADVTTSYRFHQMHLAVDAGAAKPANVISVIDTGKVLNPEEMR